MRMSTIEEQCLEGFPILSVNIAYTGSEHHEDVEGMLTELLF